MKEKQQLVGGFNSSEKHEFASWDDYSQYIYICIYIRKNKTCSKPPTRFKEPSTAPPVSKNLDGFFDPTECYRMLQISPP